MTEKLYNDDAYLFSFDATVRDCQKKGDRFVILLDRSAFFPCEGGQGADHGVIGEAQVLDVMLSGDELLHITDRTLAVGERVACKLDATRRLRHMQIHTAEHILSGVLHSLYGATNVGFHLGESEVTLDLDLPLSEAEVAAAEEQAKTALRGRVDALSGYFVVDPGLSTLAVRGDHVGTSKNGDDICARHADFDFALDVGDRDTFCGVVADVCPMRTRRKASGKYQERGSQKEDGRLHVFSPFMSIKYPSF